MQVSAVPGTSQETIEAIQAELDRWPEGLREDLEANGVSVVVGPRFQDVSPDGIKGADTGGFYDLEKRTIYITETTGGGTEHVSPGYILSTLRHEAGHAVDMTIMDNTAQKDTFGNLIHRDHKDLHGSNPDGYNEMHPTFKGTPTDTHNYPGFKKSETFAEIFADGLSPNDQTIISGNELPRTAAYVDHILDNYKNNRPPDTGLEGFDIRLQHEGVKKIQMGPRTVIIPEKTTAVDGPLLAKVEERLEAERKIPVNTAPAKPSLVEEFGRRAGVVGGVAVGAALAAGGASAAEVAVGMAEATVPGVSSVVAATEGRITEAALRGVEEIPLAGLALTEIARPILRAAGRDVDPSLGEMAIDAIGSKAVTATPQQQEFMAVYDSLPSQPTPDMPPEVAALVEAKNRITGHEQSLERVGGSMQRQEIQSHLEQAQTDYEELYKDLSSSGSLGETKKWIAENPEPEKVPPVYATRTVSPPQQVMTPS